MKKLTPINRMIIIVLIIFFSCNNDDDSNEPPSSDLIKRVATFETDFNAPYVFALDSVIEYIENKKVIRKESYHRTGYDASFIVSFTVFNYDSDNNLIERKNYTDINTTNHYSNIIYNYNENNEILSTVQNKFAPSNYGSTLYHTTKHYEYILDTIKTYSIDHLDNDFREDLTTYITYGNLDSINDNNDFMHIFDSQNNLIARNCLGNNYDCEETYNGLFQYGNSRELIVENPFYNNKVNLFLLGQPTFLGHWDYYTNYIDIVSSVYPTPERNNEYTYYNYIFDDNERLIESYSSSVGTTTRRVRYYYDL
jgi:hypothetical protein